AGAQPRTVRRYVTALRDMDIPVEPVREVEDEPAAGGVRVLVRRGEADLAPARLADHGDAVGL
ncbi:hypothetical protein ACFQ08_25705, partial [Streptosporangium algeriense]